MKKISLLMVLGIFAALALTSCNDLLNIDQNGVMKPNTYFTSDEEVGDATTSAYIDVASENLEMFRVVKNILSDDMWGNIEGHGPGTWDLNDFTFNANQEFLTNAFQGIYNVIAKCNFVIVNATSDTPFKRQMIAEAKVLRAWMYFELTTLWGNPPLITEVITNSNAQQANGDPEKLWEFIEKNLKEAIESGDLTQKGSVDDKSVYRVTKQYAQALLGKTYLWNNKPAEAAAVLDEVIESELYDLFDGEYGDINSIYCKNNKESMFESNFVYDPANPKFRLIPLFTGLRSGHYSYGEKNENPWGLSENTFGALTPRTTLYEAFVSEETASGYRVSQTMRTKDQLDAAGYRVQEVVTHEGHLFWKGRLEKDAVAGMFDISKNTQWMRFAEVLLLAAEAHLSAGNQAKADQYLNRVRRRAGLGEKTATLAAIKLEKRLELCAECVRFQDLLRWGDAEAVLKDEGSKIPFLSPTGLTWRTDINTEYGFKDKHKRLPYPANEVSMNPNLIQNPGW